MIRVYSDPLIATDVKRLETGEGSTILIVTADELEVKNPKLLGLRITFYGSTADRAFEQIVAGTKFTFRGVAVQQVVNKVYISTSLVARTFATIA